MDAVLGRASSRFVFVTLLPTLLFVGFISCLLAAGAPTHVPTLTGITTTLNRLTWPDCTALFFAILVGCVAFHPIQTPLIQLLEGYYWSGLPGGRIATHLLTERHRTLWRALRGDESKARGPASSSAQARLDWMPERDSDILPTRLGNTLRAGEHRAAWRYGFTSSILMPRLLPLLSDAEQERISDSRTQLDAAARICTVSLISVPISLVLLLPTGHWLFVPFLTFMFGWGSYRAAIAAARTFCNTIAAAVDLHHRDVWRGLALPPPATLHEERARAQVVTKYLSGLLISDAEERRIVWQDHPTT